MKSADIIIRKNCVFCNDNISANIIYKEPDYPIAIFSTKEYKIYEYIDLIYCSCNNCDIIQLMNLVKSDKMYKKNFNDTYNTPLWKDHHNKFYSFINIDININLNTSIIEIGGGNNVFGYLFQNKCKYTILDMFNIKNKLENIKYYKINGEDFNYSGNDSIIMSHVFEHLYYPRDFVMKIRSENIKDIYISIPNLSKCIEKKSICHISTGHTFFYDIDNIIRLFSEFNYELKSKEYFKDHSIFFHFILNKNYNITCIKKPNSLNIENIKNTLLTMYNNIHNIQLKGDIFIAPAGGYGSKIYYYLNNINKDKIIYFLDNNIIHHDKYLYGTNKLIKPFELLSNYSAPTVILNAGEHTTDLISQINIINSNCTIITI